MPQPAVVHPLRLTAANDAPVAPDRDVVVYWQTMARRTRYNFALEHAVAWARELERPLVVLEALRAGYPYASDRLHTFAVQGMADNAAAYAKAGVAYHAYVEPEAGAGRGLLESLGARACVVVGDEFPDFFLPRMVAAAGAKLAALGTRLEIVDGNGILPIREAGKAHVYAPQFRRLVQKTGIEHLAWFPAEEPLKAARSLPAPGAAVERLLAGVRRRWPAVPDDVLEGTEAERDAAIARLVATLPIDHAVFPVASRRGGSVAAGRVIRAFFDERYGEYATRRNEPENPANSGLSPHLHWGFTSAHELFAEAAAKEGWTPAKVAPKPNGKREGWWGMGPNGEALMDELITWRELGYNTAFYVKDNHTFETLPPWAQVTLTEHEGDARADVFTKDELEAGASYDALWNATQGQLLSEGRVHNYMRILWGKKFLEWTRTPQEALAFMFDINNRWALDGRNPNSTSGITWVLGRYDRPWGPERPVIGKVRPTSSEATAKKYRVKAYVERFTADLPGSAALQRPHRTPAGEKHEVRDRGPAKGAGTNVDVLPED